MGNMGVSFRYGGPTLLIGWLAPYGQLTGLLSMRTKHGCVPVSKRLKALLI